MSLYAVITSLFVWSFAEKSSKKKWLFFWAMPFIHNSTVLNLLYINDIMIQNEPNIVHFRLWYQLPAQHGRHYRGCHRALKGVLNNRWQLWICYLVQCEKNSKVCNLCVYVLDSVCPNWSAYLSFPISNIISRCVLVLLDLPCVKLLWLGPSCTPTWYDEGHIISNLFSW